MIFMFLLAFDSHFRFWNGVIEGERRLELHIGLDLIFDLLCLFDNLLKLEIPIGILVISVQRILILNFNNR